jgi:hypothetical protein
MIETTLLYTHGTNSINHQKMSSSKQSHTDFHSRERKKGWRVGIRTTSMISKLPGKAGANRVEINDFLWNVPKDTKSQNLHCIQVILKRFNPNRITDINTNSLFNS